MSAIDPPTAPALREGDLHWRLSDHPLTLLMFLGFRLAPMFVYLFGMFVTENFVLIFIITILLLSADFYYTKNIAGRRLVGLRWWNETNPSNHGESIWVFESADPSRRINSTDSRFFWLSLYIVPLLWFVLALVAIIKIHWIWLSLVIIALILSVTNGVAFSRADKFGNASSLAGRAMQTGLVNRFAGSFLSKVWSRG